MDSLRWQFKRASNWERDQSISGLNRINGQPFRDGDTIANHFASEWRPVLSTTHNTVPATALTQALHEFVTMPPDRILSQGDNELLMGPFTMAEVLRAIASLSRHKAAGPDGINNDFIKDYQALLAPALVTIGNDIRQGRTPPASFLEGLIIPLRKKGDSADAMDYRPIALLQSGYKVVAKVLSHRVQQVLGIPIHDTQQGFVHGRQMSKTVMMMMAHLSTASAEPEREAEDSRAILLLDFRKAYDTVSRDFLFAVMRYFGFAESFITMIRNLHRNTTARFVVNGMLSEPIPVLTGIRQGCPLALLLFLLVAEILAIALSQSTQIRGLRHPSIPDQEQKFSAFVDDSTVFLDHARQIPAVMAIVKRFGELSGLSVQPAKSVLIFLNTAVTLADYQGIPVLRHGHTTRYLGYQVGTGDLVDANWALRIRNVKKRLATAAGLSTSVAVRILLLNAIMLPAVLFTAAVFRLPRWARTELLHLQKQFMWHHSTSTEASRHKVNPGLLYTPRGAGGDRTSLYRSRHLLPASEARDEMADWETGSILLCMGSVDISGHRGLSAVGYIARAPQHWPIPHFDSASTGHPSGSQCVDCTAAGGMDDRQAAPGRVSDAPSDKPRCHQVEPGLTSPIL